MVGDMAPGRGLDADRALDSADKDALYFLVELRTLGVVERGRRGRASSLEDVPERGRLGVNGTARASLLVVGVGGTDIVLQCVGVVFSVVDGAAANIGRVRCLSATRSNRVNMSFHVIASLARAPPAPTPAECLQPTA